MSRKDEARIALFVAIGADRQPTAVLEAVMQAIEAYGAACAEEALGAPPVHSQQPDGPRTALMHAEEVLRAHLPCGHDGDEDGPHCDPDCARCAFEGAIAHVDDALNRICAPPRPPVRSEHSGFTALIEEARLDGHEIWADANADARTPLAEMRQGRQAIDWFAEQLHSLLRRGAPVQEKQPEGPKR